MDDVRWENESNRRMALARERGRLDMADDYLYKAIRERSWKRKLQFIGLALEEIDSVSPWLPPSAADRVE